MDTSISVARLVALGVPRTWQEAVAVTQDAAAAMRLTGAAASPDACVLSVNGTLLLAETGRRHDGSGESLAGLLTVLLDGQYAPPELRAALAGPVDGGFEDLSNALSFFERPNRQGDIAALAARAVAADAKARTDAEFERLRSTPHPPPAAADAPSTKRRLASGPVALAAIAVIAVAALAGAMFLARRGPAPAPEPVAAGPADASGSTEAGPAGAGTTGVAQTPSDVPPPATGVRGVVAAAGETLNGVADAGLRLLGLRPPDDVPAAPAAAPVTTKPPARSGPRRVTPPPVPANAVLAPGVTSAPMTVPSPPEAPADSGEVVDEAPPMSDEVFTDADASVQPPLMLRPQLPTEPRADRLEANGYLELLVNERGLVDQVRLRGEPSLMRDRMLVSAAKAWQFQPAMKDGHPVRYLVRVPIRQ
jgi:hypothetical protein